MELISIGNEAERLAQVKPQTDSDEEVEALLLSFLVTADRLVSYIKRVGIPSKN